MNQNKGLLALDVGEKRIGVAVADGNVKIARVLNTIEVDGQELQRIHTYIESERVSVVVIGYPRNQSGEATAQTAFVEQFADNLRQLVPVPIMFQDESLTSVLAEDQLRSSGKPYGKADIDARAAMLILQDYLEAR